MENGKLKMESGKRKTENDFQLSTFNFQLLKVIFNFQLSTFNSIKCLPCGTLESAEGISRGIYFRKKSCHSCLNKKRRLLPSPEQPSEIIYFLICFILNFTYLQSLIKMISYFWLLPLPALLLLPPWLSLLTEGAGAGAGAPTISTPVTILLSFQVTFTE